MSDIDVDPADADPFACLVPDDWEPEQADAVIRFLEAILDVLHRNYDYAVADYWRDRREAAVRCGDRRPDLDDGGMPF